MPTPVQPCWYDQNTYDLLWNTVGFWLSTILTWSKELQQMALQDAIAMSHLPKIDKDQAWSFKLYRPCQWHGGLVYQYFWLMNVGNELDTVC